MLHSSINVYLAKWCLHPLSSPLSLLCRASISSGTGGGGRHPRKAVVGDKNIHASTVVPPIIGSDDYVETLALPWGDINVVVVTDVHSWIGRTRRRRRRRRGDDDTGWNKGRTTGDDGDDGDDDDDDDGVLGERSLDADYGHVLSFYQRLKEYADGESGINGGEGEAAVEAASLDRIIKKRRDLFFVMNGDFLDGTGLSTVPPQYLAPLLRQYMPWDAINVGNHELYHDGMFYF